MTLSTEVRAVTYPALKKPAQPGAESRAYTHGHSSGYTAGLRKASEEAAVRRAQMEDEHTAARVLAEAREAHAIEALSAAVAALHAAVVPVVTDAQDTLVEAALDLAETIIGVELTDQELSSRTALARALDGAPSAGTVTVKMNPADLAALPAAAGAGVALAADPSLQRGDAVAEYEHGHVNARIGAALDRARAALLGDPA